MAEWLFLRWPRADTAASWLVTNGEGRPLAPLESGTLAQAANAAAERRVAVLVNSADVLCLDVDLPARSGPRAAQLVPFALEEQLAADVEAQHFAVGRTESSGRTAVAVVTRTLIDDWMGQLKQASIVPELMCTEAALMPRISGHTIALLENETLCLVGADGHATVVSAPPAGFAGALAVGCGEHVGQTHLLLHAATTEWEQRSAEIEASRALLATLKVQLLSSGSLPWLASQLPVATPINLLQGPYVQRQTFSEGWSRWRLAASLAAALVVLHLGSQAFSLWRLHRTERELDGAIAALVGPTLSAGSGSIRARLETKLHDADAAGGRAGLLPALQGLAQAMNGIAGARLQALTFRDNTVQLKLHASDAQSLDRINQSLRAAGWHAELTSGATAGDAYEGNIDLHSGVS